MRSRPFQPSRLASQAKSQNLTLLDTFATSAISPPPLTTSASQSFKPFGGRFHPFAYSEERCGKVKHRLP
ncbi:MAG: hypothetical protein ACTS4T_01010 [Candidatus Hodgkinia cicadicola]